MPEKEQALAACHGAIVEAMSRTANAPPEARALIEALAAALPLADQPVTSSCFCRGRAGGPGTA